MDERVATRLIRDLADQPSLDGRVEHLEVGIDPKADDLRHDGELELGAAGGGRIQHRVCLGGKRADRRLTGLSHPDRRSRM